MLKRSKNRRKDAEKRKFRLPAIHWRRLGLATLSLVAVVLAVSLMAWTLDQPIQSVSVAGRFQRVSPADVERAVKLQVRGMGIVSVRLAGVQRAIKALPWVDTVSVQRAWPRGLKVTVTEQAAAARWGARGLINTRGDLFESDATHIPPELAQLSGPDGHENEVAQRYLAAQGRLIEAGLRLTALRLDARGAWEFDLSNGVTVRLGGRQVDERFERFMSTALRLVTQRADSIAYVDMRYTNGFAVGWRAGVTTRPLHETERRNA